MRSTFTQIKTKKPSNYISQKFFDRENEGKLTPCGTGKQHRLFFRLQNAIIIKLSGCVSS